MVLKNNKPYHFLVIGNGRWALHLKRYLQILQLPYDEWTRSSSFEELTAQLEKSTHALLCISDSAIAEFTQQNLKNFSGLVVHFSGALEFKEILGLHPLMTFGPELYTENIYRSIPFVTTSIRTLDEILPGFSNPLFQLHADQKAYYHALCVIGGNLTGLLVQKMLAGFVELGLPKEVGSLYLQQVLKNVLSNPAKALTGPLARKDIITIKKNLQSLSGDPFVDVYKSFIPIAFPEMPKETAL